MTKLALNEFADGHSVLHQGVPLDNVQQAYLDGLFNMRNNLKPEISGRRKAGWTAYNSTKNVVETTSHFGMQDS